MTAFQEENAIYLYNCGAEFIGEHQDTYMYKYTFEYGVLNLFITPTRTYVNIIVYKGADKFVFSRRYRLSARDAIKQILSQPWGEYDRRTGSTD